jgi:hypothetical protein
VTNNPRVKVDADVMNTLLKACAQVPVRDRLDALLIVWLGAAANARLQAPDGFAAEQARQVARLRELAETVAGAVRDTEMERLAHEGDTAGMLRRLDQLNARGGPVQ